MSRSRQRPGLESLEGRALLATAGVDYLLTGYRWSNPSHISYSIAPDGVTWDQGANNLNATFDAKFGNGTWQAEIARALATWESVANINMTQVSDAPLPMGTPGQWQGDPRFGDIRFGGYTFADNTTLAQSFAPSFGNGTGAGDVEVNTSMPWQIGSGFDFYSVMLHETGLTLGLGEPPNPNVVMSTVYGGVRQGLTADDIAGIQAIYGPRAPDSYQSQGQGLAVSNAIDLTGQMNASGQGVVNGVSLATIGDTEYFSVIAPPGSGEGLSVAAIAGNVSLLSPKVSVLDPSGTPIDTEGNPSAYGDNILARAAQVVPGQRYYIAVTGATRDVFAVGAYQLQFGFSGVAGQAPLTVVTPPPVATPPPVVTPLPVAPPPVVVPAIPPDRFEPNNSIAQATPMGTIAAPFSVPYLTLDSASDLDFFTFQNATAGIYQVSAPGTELQVLDSSGTTIASGAGQVAVQVFNPGTKLYVGVSSTNGLPVANYTLTVTPPTPTVTPSHPGPGSGHVKKIVHRAHPLFRPFH